MLGPSGFVIHWLSPTPSLSSQPWSLPVQLQPDTIKTLTLFVSFDHTFLTCIRQGLPPELEHGPFEFWREAAVYLAEQVNWAALQLASEEGLSNFTALAPGDPAPEELALAALDISSSGWAAVSTPTKPALLLVQSLRHMVTLMHHGHQSDLCIKKAAQQMHVNINQIRLQQDDVTTAASKANPHIKCLRAALLMMKLLQLLTTLEVEEKRVQDAVGSVCPAVTAALKESFTGA